MSDIQGIKEANDTGFALLAAVQGARQKFQEVAAAASEARSAAEAERSRVIKEANDVFQAVVKDQAIIFLDLTNAETAKADAAKQEVSKAEEALRKHQEDTKAKFGTSLDYAKLLSLLESAPSGGRVRL